MTTQKTLSSLAIASIALFVLSVSAAAQSNAKSTTVTAHASNVTLALNRNPFAGVSASKASVSNSETKPTLSTEMFTSATKSSNGFTKDNQFSFSSQSKLYESTTFNSKPQFDVNDPNGVQRGSSVTFVPSFNPLPANHPWMPNR